MSQILDNAFWLVVTADGMLLVILALLAMAAEPSSRLRYAWDVTRTLFLLPSVLLAAAVVMHLRATSPSIRWLALLLAASPWVVVAARKLRDKVDDALYKDAQGRMRYFKDGPMRQIADAVIAGDEATVAAIAKSVDLNQRGYTGMTLVTLALSHRTEDARKRVGALRALLAAGANPNLGSRYRLPLELACGVGVEPVRLLLAAGADPNQKTPEGKPAFFEAIGLPIDRAVFPMMLERGANLLAVDRKGRTALELARINGDHDALRLITTAASAQAEPGADNSSSER